MGSTYVYQEFPLSEPDTAPTGEVSDSESGVTGSSCLSSTCDDSCSRSMFPSCLAVELGEGERAYELIRRRFVAGVGEKAVVTAVHRRNWAEDETSLARVQSFQVYGKALETKYCCGETNNNNNNNHMKFGWFGCGSKDRVRDILARGFGYQDLQANNGVILLSPDHSPTLSVEDSGTDEDGLRHMLLCRVLLGRSELVDIESGQTGPSSNKFDSGVIDSYDKPNKYVIWSNNMNTHILPEYVVTFKLKSTSQSQSQSPLKGVNSSLTKMKNGIKMPTSPWISFPTLISVLSKFLVPDAIALVTKFHKDYKERKILRPELIQKVRLIAGDKLLIAVIKSCKGTVRNSGCHATRTTRTNNYYNN